MRYRIDGQQVFIDAGLGAFATPAPLAMAGPCSASPDPLGLAGFGQNEGSSSATCTDNPRWMPSAFDKKASWCMCGGGKTLRRCPGCCGPCPPCPPRRCQQPSYKVFATAEHYAYDCKCGPCGGAAT